MTFLSRYVLRPTPFFLERKQTNIQKNQCRLLFVAQQFKTDFKRRQTLFQKLNIISSFFFSLNKTGL